MSTRTRRPLGFAEDTIAEAGDTGVVLLGVDPSGKYAAVATDTTGAVKIAGIVGVTDGDKGDITVTGAGTTWTIDPDVVTYDKIQNVSATDKVLGRATGGAGDVEEITCTAAGRALIDDTTATAQRNTLALGATDTVKFNVVKVGSNELSIGQIGFSVEVPQLVVVGVSAFNGSADGTIGMVLQAPNATSRAAVFSAASAATADIIQVYGAGSSLKLNVAANGNVGLGPTVPGAKLHAQTGAAGTIGEIVQGAASQTANLTEWQDSSAGVLAAITAGGSLQMAEMTAPAAPAANNVRIFAQDNGAGKTQLMALFPTGAAVQLAIEP